MSSPKFLSPYSHQWLPLFLVLTASALLIAPGQWIAGTLHLWAFSFLIYVPWSLRLLMAILLIVATLPPLQRSIWRWLSHLPALPAWLLIPGAGLLFILLRERTFYGDHLAFPRPGPPPAIRTFPAAGPDGCIGPSHGNADYTHLQRSRQRPDWLPAGQPCGVHHSRKRRLSARDLCPRPGRGRHPPPASTGANLSLAFPSPGTKS